MIARALSACGCLLLLLCPAGARAQSVGATITGTVRDATGSVMPQVRVSAQDDSRAAVRVSITDAAGRYVLPALPPGACRVTAEKDGFRTAVVENVVLEVNQTVRVDLELEVGPVIERVTVNGAASLVEGDSSSLGQVVHPRQIVEMPLNGRNFVQLGLLSAGVAALPEGGFSSTASTFTNRTNSSLIINGNRESDNSWLVDGVETRGPWMGITQLQPSVDAIQEFKVQRLNYAAEFGMGGGIVNIVMRAGSNQFHGSLFEFLRNEIFDARGFFDGAKVPALRMNQFGASLGGPVRRERTYFFGAWESLRQHRRETIRSSFPSEAMLTGDFREQSKAVSDPLTGSLVICEAVGVFCPVPFPGKMIPARRLSPIAQAIAGYWPRPNMALDRGVNHQTTAAAGNDADQYHVRLDQRFSSRDDVFVRFSSTDARNNLPGAARYFGMLFPQTPQNLGAGYTHVFRPSRLNEFRLGYNRTRWSLSLEPAPVNIAKQVGFKNQEGLPPEAWGLPFVNVAGYFTGQINGSFGPPVPESHDTQGGMVQLVDHLTLVAGRHTWKTGVDLRYDRTSQVNGVFVNGVVAFAGLYSGSGAGDLVLGYPMQFAGSTNVANSRMSSVRWAAFVQDDFRVSSDLTFNFGVRYDRFSRPIESQNRTGLWEDGRLYFPADVTSLLPANLRALATVGGVSRGVVEPDKNNIAPRSGFAWRPWGNSRTVVRGGYGLVYLPDAGTQFGAQKPPFLNLTSQFNSFATPNFSLSDLVPDTASGVPLNLFTENRYNRDPYVQQWNLTLQREIGRNTLVEAAYAGQVSHKLSKRHNANQAIPGTSALELRAPYPLYGEVVLINNESNANYHALQTRLDRSFATGFSALLSYSWSKSIDTDSGVLEPASTQNRLNRRLERAPSDYDVPHRATASFLWEVPFGPGRRFGAHAGKPALLALAGWQVSGISTFSAGTPFYVSTTTPIGTSEIFGANRANRLCDGNLPRAQRRPERWFDIACFADHALGAFGNAGRNILRQAGLHNWDLSLMKRAAVLKEKVMVQLRAEFFNALNRTHFSRPGNVVSQPVNFGMVTQNVRAGGRSREIQVGVKLLF